MHREDQRDRWSGEGLDRPERVIEQAAERGAHAEPQLCAERHRVPSELEAAVRDRQAVGSHVPDTRQAEPAGGADGRVHSGELSSGQRGG